MVMYISQLSSIPALLCQFFFLDVLVKYSASHPYGSVGTSIILYSFNNVSSLLVLNVCWIAPHIVYVETVVVYYMPHYYLCRILVHYGARGGVVGWGITLQTRTSRVRFPMVSLDIIPWHNRFSRTMALGSTQPLTEMSTRIFTGR
jgi:hypothetical protein